MKEAKIEKLYKDTGLSPHMEDYMETIIILTEKNKVVRVKDIARELDIKMPSVTAALNKLKDMDLIEYEKYGYIELTPEGKEIAELVYNRHSCLCEFFEKVFLIDNKDANSEACKVEHHLSTETCKRMHQFLAFFNQELEKKQEWIERLKKYFNKSD